MRVADDQTIAFMYAEGMSLRDVASSLGVSKSYVEHSLRKQGISRRTQSEAGRFPQAAIRSGKTAPAVERAIVDRYASGETLESLMAAFDVSDATIYAILRRYNAPLHGQPRQTPVDVEQRVVEMYRSGKTLLQIGAALGMSGTQARKILMKHGVERRPPAYVRENPVARDYGDENFPTEWIEAPPSVPRWMIKYRDRRTGKFKPAPVSTSVQAGHFDSLIEVTFPPFDSDSWKLRDITGPHVFSKNLIAGLARKKTLAIGSPWELYRTAGIIEGIVTTRGYWGPLRDAFSLITPIFDGSPIWWVDLDDGPQREASLLDLVTMRHPNLSQKPDGSLSQIWLMSLDQWNNGDWPLESEGGPPAHGTSRIGARENPVESSGSELICMGRKVEFDLRAPPIGVSTRSKNVAAPRDAGMLYDASGRDWPRCSLLIAEFDRGKTETEEGSDYFGRNAIIYEGGVDLPPVDIASWHKLGEIDEIFYDRAGTKHPGYFRHTFNKARNLTQLILYPFKRKAFKQAAVLYSLWRRKTSRQFYRVELPEGCIVDDRGIVVP
jgi:transposase